jgi:hypothetical protein
VTREEGLESLWCYLRLHTPPRQLHFRGGTSSLYSSEGKVMNKSGRGDLALNHSWSCNVVVKTEKRKRVSVLGDQYYGRNKYKVL